MPRRGRWVRGLRTPDKTSLLLLAPGLAPLNKERQSSRLRSPAGCHCSRNQSLCTPAVLWAASTCPQPAQRHQRASPDCSSPASSSCSCCVPSSAAAPLASSCCCSGAAAAARAAACFLAPFFDLLAASASSFSIAASCTAGQGQRKRECGTRRWAQRPAIAWHTQPHLQATSRPPLPPTLPGSMRSTHLLLVLGRRQVSLWGASWHRHQHLYAAPLAPDSFQESVCGGGNGLGAALAGALEAALLQQAVGSGRGGRGGRARQG